MKILFFIFFSNTYKKWNKDEDRLLKKADRNWEAYLN